MINEEWKLAAIEEYRTSDPERWAQLGQQHDDKTRRYIALVGVARQQKNQRLVLQIKIEAHKNHGIVLY